MVKYIGLNIKIEPLAYASVRLRKPFYQIYFGSMRHKLLHPRWQGQRNQSELYIYRRRIVEDRRLEF